MSLLIQPCHCALQCEHSLGTVCQLIRIKHMFLYKIIVFAQILGFIKHGLTMKQSYFKRKTGQYLPNKVIASKHAQSELHCAMACTALDVCLSINYKVKGVDKGLCQLNNDTVSKNLSLVFDEELDHLSVVKRVKYFYNSPHIVS